MKFTTLFPLVVLMTTTLFLTVPTPIDARPRPSPPSGGTITTTSPSKSIELKQEEGPKVKKDLTAKHGIHFVLLSGKSKKEGGAGTRIPLDPTQVEEVKATFKVVHNMLTDVGEISQKSGKQETGGEIPIHEQITKEEMTHLLTFAHDYSEALKQPGHAKEEPPKEPSKEVAKEPAKEVAKEPSAQEKAIEAAVTKFTTAHCVDPNHAITYMVAVNYLDNEHLLKGIAKKLAEWIEKTRRDTEAQVDQDIKTGKITLKKDETKEEHAATIWSPIVNKMFGYPEHPEPSSSVGGIEEKKEELPVEEKSGRTIKSSKLHSEKKKREKSEKKVDEGEKKKKTPKKTGEKKNPGEQ